MKINGNILLEFIVELYFNINIDIHVDIDIDTYAVNMYY